MNRAARLLKVVPGAPRELVAALAARPVAEVDLIIALARQARRDERQHQADRRRQRKKDDARYGNYDESDLTGRNVRQIRKQGVRAGNSLDAFAGLVEARDATDERIDCAARELLAAHVATYEEIGQVLGITKQSAWSKFSGQASLTRAEPAAGGGPG